MKMWSSSENINQFLMCYQHYNLNLISQLQRQSMPEPVPDVVNQIVDNNNDLLILAISCTNSQSD